jgi:hypothetical protein
MSKFYIGQGKRLSDSDFVSIAHAHGLEEAELRAVAQVEARNKGVHSSGAVIALYEPHIAWRYTKGAVRAKLKTAGLAYPKWRRNYPKSSYPRIDKCTQIAGEEVAALSSSWGLGQIMGFNHKACGYDTAVEMVKDFAVSERNQLDAMVRFIKANSKMFAALKAHNWSGFAYRYNGPGYKKNDYDTKLANAYRSWVRKIAKRTKPIKPAPAPCPYPARDHAEAGQAHYG